MPIVHVVHLHTKKIVPPRGPKHFGWDPIFEPALDLQLNASAPLTYAEMEPAQKNSISHRYRALEKLRTYVAEHTADIERELSGKVPKMEAQRDM